MQHVTFVLKANTEVELELKVGLQHLYTVEGKILVPVYTQYRLEKASGALH